MTSSACGKKENNSHAHLKWNDSPVLNNKHYYFEALECGINKINFNH